MSIEKVTKIVFGSGNAYEIIGAYNDGLTRYIQGQNRPVVDVQLPAAQYDAIRAEALNSDGSPRADNLSAIKLTEDITTAPEVGEPSTQHAEYPKTNMLIVQECALKSVEVTPETDTSPAVTELRTSLVLAQSTYLETTQQSQAAAQAAQAEAIAELSILVAGGVA